MGVGAYLTANMQEYEYYEGDYYNTEAIVLSYSNIEDQRSHASMSFGGGLGIGVSAQIVDKDIEVPEVGIGAGGLYGMGYGSMFHIKHLPPNFEKLFTLLDLGFDPTY